MKKILSSVVVLSIVAAMAIGLTGCKKDEPAPTPTPAPTATPVVEVDVDVVDIVDTMIGTYQEDYLATEKIDASAFTELTGIPKDMYEEVFAAISPMNVQVDALMIVKPVEGKSEDVVAGLEAYRESLLTSEAQYPVNLAKIEASVVEEYGDYVIYRNLGAYYDPEVAAEDEVGSEAEATAEPTETTETEATTAPDAVDETTDDTAAVEEEAMAEFYANETLKGTEALTALFEEGFTAMTEEARAEVGYAALYGDEEEPTDEDATVSPAPADETDTDAEVEPETDTTVTPDASVDAGAEPVENAPADESAETTTTGTGDFD